MPRCGISNIIKAWTSIILHILTVQITFVIGSPGGRVSGVQKHVEFCLLYTSALSAGMDSAIMDPCNKEMMAALFATEALLGRDKFCRNYNKAYRKGIIKY